MHMRLQSIYFVEGFDGHTELSSLKHMGHLRLKYFWKYIQVTKVSLKQSYFQMDKSFQGF